LVQCTRRDQLTTQPAQTRSSAHEMYQSRIWSIANDRVLASALDGCLAILVAALVY